MPLLSRWFIKAALVHLLAGFTLGALILAAKGGIVDARIWVWLLPHADIVIVGWMLQLAMGMGYWILPRIRDAGRGRAWLAATAFGLLNSGLVIGAGLAWLRFFLPDWSWTDTAFVFGVLLQVVAVIAFVLHAGPRVLPTITNEEWQRRKHR